VSGSVWCRFGGVSFCCLWESLGLVWGIEFELCVGQILWVWGSELVLCVLEFRVGLWELVCAVCGIVFCRFWE